MKLLPALLSNKDLHSIIILEYIFCAESEMKRLQAYDI